MGRALAPAAVTSRRKLPLFPERLTGWTKEEELQAEEGLHTACQSLDCPQNWVSAARIRPGTCSSVPFTSSAADTPPNLHEEPHGAITELRANAVANRQWPPWYVEHPSGGGGTSPVRHCSADDTE
jgi:hypothetical protein